MAGQRVWAVVVGKVVWMGSYGAALMADLMVDSWVAQSVDDSDKDLVGTTDVVMVEQRGLQRVAEWVEM